MNQDKSTNILILIFLCILVIISLYFATSFAQNPLQPFVDMFNIFLIVGITLFFFFIFIIPLIVWPPISNWLQTRPNFNQLPNKFRTFLIIYFGLAIIYWLSTTILTLALATQFNSSSSLVPYGGFALILLYRTATAGQIRKELNSKSNAKQTLKGTLTCIKPEGLISDTVFTAVLVMMISAVVVGGVPKIDFTQQYITNLIILVPLIDLAVNEMRLLPDGVNKFWEVE